MGEVYNSTLKEATRRARKELADAERNYELLEGKETEFAKDILAWIEVKKKVLRAYEESNRNL